MDFIKRAPSIKLLSADGRAVARIVPPVQPNPPPAILLGERLFVLRDRLGYRETEVYVAPLDSIMSDPESPAPSTCLARACGFMAVTGTYHCELHTLQHRAGADRAATRAEVEALAGDDEPLPPPPSRGRR